MTARRGAALALAVYALAVVGTLVAAMFVLALAEHRVGRSTVSLTHARSAAEEGALYAIASWDGATLTGLVPGDSAAFAGVTNGGTGRFEGVVIKLGPWSYVVRCEGAAIDGTARRVVGLMVQVDSGGTPRPLRERAWVWLY